MSPLPAFVLHAQAYKETSALLDLLTPNGRVRAVLRGARQRSGSLARPFVALEVECKGRGELKTLSRLEAQGIPLWLTGSALYSGFYLNELLVRLLPMEDACPEVFEQYQHSLKALASGKALEPILRDFEWCLLNSMGYGFALDYDQAGQPIEADRGYRFDPLAGFSRDTSHSPSSFQGTELLALQQARWEAPGALTAAKRLMRLALAPHLGSRPLVSRTLFTSYQQDASHVSSEPRAAGY
ncbi:DNA replication and repair protein RecO [Azomonas agilis]|uniref:DNA repair protein RecO n=1 Tax=Azomonas agilis TaxID=116849 RepID=A0A562HZY9_9GAMM|nr:DNA repair protein RecO [Azomonas agilis]TWH64331.1 DNA replication and repair protein RecO [Azomonas agilis]